MSSQQRIQRYLERHKIGPLFEELMARVVKELPDEPLVYMLKVLNRKAEKLGLIKKPTPEPQPKIEGPKRSGSPSASKRRSTESKPSAASWVADSGKPRSYSKPWKSGSKKSPSPPRERSANQRPGVRKSAEHELEDLWGSGTGSRSGPRPKSPEARTRDSWKQDTTAVATQPSAGRGYGYRGPLTACRSAVSDELKLSAPTPKNAKTETPSISSRKLDARSQAAKHRADLQRSLTIQQQSSTFTEPDSDLQPDTALTLMESADDLRREGVTNIPKSNLVYKRRPQKSATGQGQSDFLNTLLQKVMTSPPRIDSTGDLNSLEQPGSLEDRLFESSSRPQTAGSERYTEAYDEVDDDDFESISQVTGPRRPVWTGSDDEAGVLSGRPNPVLSASADMTSAHRDRVQPMSQSLTQLPATRHSWRDSDNASPPFEGEWGAPPAPSDSSTLMDWEKSMSRPPRRTSPTRDRRVY